MEPDPEDPTRLARRIGRVAELYHSVNYYSPEINRLTEHGFRGWWHAYLAYRPAPLGPVDEPVVTAVFYNFAPRFVARAVPGVWDIMTPSDVLASRDELVAESLARIFPADGPHRPLIDEAAALAREAIDGLPTGARPLTAALLAMPRPDDPPLALWHACTVMRELRGDGHNVALAAARIDGAASHVLMAAQGQGDKPTIQGIRGWNDDEWNAAVAGLAARGIVDGDGHYTEDGRRFRTDIERTTDRLCLDLVDNLGAARAGRLCDLLDDLGGHLTGTGEVPGVWPPPAVRRQ